MRTILNHHKGSTTDRETEPAPPTSDVSHAMNLLHQRAIERMAARRSARNWRTVAIAATVSTALLAILFALAMAGGLGRTHAQPEPVIPHCAGCGYEVTTFYPNHQFRTVNYFSAGGSQVTKEGVWVAPSKGASK